MTIAPTSAHRRASTRPLLWLVLLALVLVGVGAFAFGRALDDSGSTTGAVKGSGVEASATRELPPFTGVELEGGNVVLVRLGGEQAVVVRGDDNLLELVTTEVRAGRLVVGQRESFETSAPMHVEVTVPELTSVALTGGGVIQVDGLAAEAVSVSVPGGG